MDNILSKFSYPIVLLIAIALHQHLLTSQSLTVSTYLPIFFAVLAVTILEILTPERAAWHPKGSEVGNDALYMVTIQILLPRLLAFSFVLFLIDPMRNSGLVLENYWPHQWPMSVQVVMMILAADFFRYWLHRFAHENAFLWRFHAVHHSVPKLYWLNVGRFHYIDKFLQFLFDALPFILLGVNEEVIALYFVFYSINGFFQHSNIKLQFGFLNYIISTAELHRWHHSRVSTESNMNYGNNIIIWDLLFGTWYFPQHRKVDKLGLRNTNYPTSFTNQLKTPYIDGSNERDTVLLNYRDILRNWLIKIGMLYNGYFLWRPLEKNTLDPGKAQKALLQKILFDYRFTGFGRKFSFDRISNYEEFVDQVPVQTYEDLWPFIKAQLATGKIELTPTIARMYALTSGTTDRPKMLPVLDQTLKNQRRTQRIFSYLQYRQTPDAFNGKMFGIMGAPVEGHLDNGVPYGSVSGVLYQNMPWFLRNKYVIPAAVFDIPEYELKYLLILRLAMAEPNITYMGSANPSTFLKLQTLMLTYGQQLIEDIKTGQFYRKQNLNEPLARKIEHQLQAKPTRAHELQMLLDQYSLTIANVWPHLRLLTTWTGGSCGIVLDQLQQFLPEHTRVVDLGYIASEFHGTIPYDYKDKSGIPLLSDNFYEFVPKTDWEKGNPLFLLLDQLEQGKDYYIFITTQSGLFRYQMDDIIRMTGLYNKTPVLRFIQKGKGITSITGEKLYEIQIIDAIESCCKKMNMARPFFMALANKNKSCYEVFIESNIMDKRFAEDLDRKLAEINLEYEAKRKSGRLHSIELSLLKPGTSEAYKLHMIQSGQREGQYKPLLLQYKETFDFPIEDYVS
jgi:sterol desaturase/sphingolipid hydroxylase (fatty acid hydroxylase superfamily)